MDELISVIIPCFNVEKYIDRCMESVLNQTYQNLEIILVDDGSTDRTGEICDHYSKIDTRIKVIHKKNGGVSTARNIGLDICSGDFIFFVDSDDWISFNAIQYLYDLRKKYEADFSMAEYICVYNQKSEAYCHYKEYELTQQEFLVKLFKIGTQENAQYPFAKLYKKKLFNNIRFAADLLIAEDVLSTFQIALNSKGIAYSTKIIYFYYYNPNSLTKKAFADQSFDLIKAWDLVCENANQSGKSWISLHAQINRKRADFGILMDLAISNISLNRKLKYLPKIQKNKFDLRNNVFDLCKAKIPLSRKILIICFAANYPACMFILHLFSQMRYRMLKKRSIETENEEF